MLQHWLNIIGLTFDFFGVLLLSYEWWIAMRAEERETEIAAQQARLKPSPMMPRNDNPNQAVFDHMNEQLRFNQQLQRIRAARGMRRGYYLLALGLISSGFLMQILGSWPGGIAGL